MAKTKDPLSTLAKLIELVTWVVGVAALAIVIANLSGLGWLPGTSANPTCVEGVSACVENPTGKQRLADVADQVPPALFEVAALLLLLRFLKTASKEGPYSATVPGKLKTLGWFVLIAAPVSALVVALAHYSLRRSMGAYVLSTDWLTEWNESFPWWAIVAGVTALTFARILRVGVEMAKDLEGTV
jgi:hypothetical protein